MKKLVITLTLMLLMAGLLPGQTWIHHYPVSDLCPGPYTSMESEACNVIPAIGGGYLLHGYVEFASGDIPTYDRNVFWKLDENGNIIWRRTGDAGSPYDSIVSNGVDRYYCLKTSSGFSYLQIFDSELNNLAFYVFYYNNGYHASLYDMQYVDDGLVFAGKVSGQAVVIKTDYQFNVVWQSSTFLSFDGARAIEPYGDGWISLSGRVFTEINAEGDTLWTYYDPINYTSFFDCTVSADSSIYLLGHYKIWKVNTLEHSLDLVADNVPGGFDSDFFVRSIDMLPNGNIVYTGRSGNNERLHSYSPAGVHQWSRAYNIMGGGGYFGTGSKNLLVMPDGSILFCMYLGDIVLIKTDPEGIVVANDDPVAPAPVASIMCYPQPASSKVMISVKSDLVGDMNYSIYNIRGQKLYSALINGQHKEPSFKLPGEVFERMSNGIYLISLENGDNRIATTKLVVAH